MPLAPFATLRASINGAAVVTGGITCAGGETVVLSADPAGALTSFKIEIYDYPPEFALPSGWTSIVNAVGQAIYTCTPSNGIAPIFTLDSQAHFWKYMFRLTGNNGDNGGNKNIPTSQLIYEKTAITIPGASGLQQIGFNESNQFLPNSNSQLQKNLRIVDTIASSAASSTAKAPAALLGTSNLALTGEQTIDGTLTSGTRVLLIAQSTSSQNGLWITAAGAWARPSDFNVDAQVVTGQTIFITGGSVNQKTNWQLTSGSTIAGAKTYAQLVSGSSSTALQPVDAVATTNNALSGTTAIDGVTLTANTSRVVAVAQTTASQNGPWLVQAGAWTRPTDFAVDAQVIAGQSVYVKSGTLGAGTSWQLTAGSTIAGSKTFAKLSLVKHDAVRAVQTAALPAYTYSAGVITATANGALAVTAFDGLGPASSPALLVGDRVLVTLELAKNGIYTVTALGSGGAPYALTRAADLSASPGFLGGVQVDVLDGLLYKGTRWFMTNIAAVTLDTTATTWAQMRPRGAQIDLSQTPYNIKDWPSFATWAAADGTDYSVALGQFFWDYRNTPGTTGILPSANGGIIVISEPFSRWGNVMLEGKGNRIVTGGLGTAIGGGYACTCYALGQNFDTVDHHPLIGPAVDSSSGATSLSTYRDAQNAIGYNFFWDLTRGGGVLVNGWTAFEYAEMFQFESVTASGIKSFLAAYQGRRTNLDDNDGSGNANYLFTLSLDESGGANQGKITGKLRLTDTTAGVYGSTTHVGTGTSAVTGGAMTPTADAANFTIRVEAPGTIGTADSKSVSFAVDGVRFCSPILLGTANALALVQVVDSFAQVVTVATSNITLSGEQTLNGVTTSASRVGVVSQTTPSQNGIYTSSSGAWTRAADLNTDAQCIPRFWFSVSGGTLAGKTYVLAAGTTIAGSKTFVAAMLANCDTTAVDEQFFALFNFGAGTLVGGGAVAKDTYAIPCSGCTQLITLTSSTVCTTGVNYVVRLQYRGGKVYLYVSVAGGTLDAGASTTGVTATGVALARYWENLVVGLPVNNSAIYTNFSFIGSRGYIGSVRMMSSSVSAPPSTEVTTLASTLFSGQAFHWIPKTADTRSTPSTTLGVPNTPLRQRYRAENELANNFVWLVPRTPNPGAQFSGGGFRGVTFDLGSTPGARANALLSVGWLNYVWKDLGSQGGVGCLDVVGPDFGSSIDGLTLTPKWGIGLTYFQGSLNLSGKINLDSSGPCLVQASTCTINCASASLFINVEEGFLGGTSGTRCAFIWDAAQTSTVNFSIDAENAVNAIVGSELVRVAVLTGSNVTLSGTIFAVDSQSAIYNAGDDGTNGVGGTITLQNLTLQNAGFHQLPPPLYSRSIARPFVEGPGVNFIGLTGQPSSLPPGHLLVHGQTRGPTALNGAADGTYSWVEGVALKLSNGTATANRAYTLSVTGMRCPNQFRVTVEAQTHTVTIINGGPAGGNVCVLAVGFDGTVDIRLNEAGNLERV